MADGKGDIVIKKIKKGGHGAHGGAWKVAYADFVTAMMAFFLLLWLLNATEAEKLAGLADYFAPTVGIKGELGIGFKGGKAALTEGIGSDKNTNRGIIHGGTPTGPIVKVTERIETETEQPEDERIQVVTQSNTNNGDQEASDEEKSQATAVETLAQQIVSENPELKSMIDVEITPEGLQVQLKDSDNESMFIKGTASLKPSIQKALSQLAQVMQHLPNFVSISGHTSSVPVSEKADYTNWELSADRANATRRFLIESGMDPEQFVRIVGRSDNDPFDPQRPNHPSNNRIKIVLLRDRTLPQHKQSAPDQLLIDTKSKEVQQVAPVKPPVKPEKLMKEMMRQIEEAPSDSPQ